MRSSTGKYFIALDHVRALAAYIVFAWHFIHINNGHQAPPPVFPLSILTEGHTGVALFMCLSGYLFAKLLDDKYILYLPFLWNRFLRLVPLLLVVIVVVGVQQYRQNGELYSYVKSVVSGIIRPSLPNGGWSITAEFHFYLLLPLLLFATKRWRYSLLIAVPIILILRYLLFLKLGQIQTLSYWTIIGRIDQFLFGILAYVFRKSIAKRHVLVLVSLFSFAAFYWWFDFQGGFYKSPSYPSPSVIWVFLPAIEGVIYSLAISWYDNSFSHSAGKFSRLIALIGTYSYSIYLLHFFVVFKLASFISLYVVDLSDLHVAVLVSPFAFLVMIPIGCVSYRFIEKPFLSHRTSYAVSHSVAVCSYGDGFPKVVANAACRETSIAT